MYEKNCKWCNNLIVVEKQVLFASHVASCKMNPNVEKRNKENSEKLKGILKVERFELNKECPECGNIFSIIATKSEIKSNRTKKFCSRRCSNKRVHSEETKNKISNTLTEGGNRFTPPPREKQVTKFTCIKCGEEGFDYRYNKNRKYHNDCWKSISGGIRKGSSRGKSGWYKGFWCDSSYELAFVIYNIDNNIEFRRNTNGFRYNYNNKNYLFYPDFIVNNKYIEIKNYKSDLTDSKISNFPHSIEVYYKEEMKFYLDYVKNKYGKDYISLYE